MDSSTFIWNDKIDIWGQGKHSPTPLTVKLLVTKL